MIEIINDIKTYLRIHLGEPLDNISYRSNRILSKIQPYFKKWLMRFAITMCAYMGSLILCGLAHKTHFFRSVLSSTDFMYIIVVFTTTGILSTFGIAVYERFEKHYFPLDFLICTLAMAVFEFGMRVFTGLSMVERLITILGMVDICYIVCKKEWWVKKVRFEATSFVSKCKNAAVVAFALSTMIWLMLREIEWRLIKIVTISIVMFIFIVMIETAEEFSKETKELRRWG